MKWYVCVWTICTDVKLPSVCFVFCSTIFLPCMQGGSESHSIHCPTKTVVWDCDIGTDHPDVPAIFQFIVNGNRLSQVPACRSKPFQLLHCCRNLALFYFILSSVASEPSSEQGRRKHTSNWISRWINQVSPVKLYWIVCARSMHSTSVIR